jgi:Ca-activated chloride channel family protein
MWNYEAVLLETNAELGRRGAEPLYAIYPSDGMASANSPLGFVDRGKGETASAFFSDLQRHLLSAPVQSRIEALGRRPAVGESGAQADPSWNYDPKRLVTLVRMPEASVVRAALELYQDVLRRPSLTVYCLDFSGSMSGAGERALKDSMRLVLTRKEASRLLVQHGDADRIVVIPFDSEIRTVSSGTGSVTDSERLLRGIESERSGGGTDIYACAREALSRIQATKDLRRYLPAIVLMTDGRSTDHAQSFMAEWRKGGGDVPVFGLSFGDADVRQLDGLATLTNARVFDGSKSLRDAFRTVRGYN